MITRSDERSFNSAIDLFVEFGVLCARKRGGGLAGRWSQIIVWPSVVSARRRRERIKKKRRAGEDSIVARIPCRLRDDAAAHPYIYPSLRDARSGKWSQEMEVILGSSGDATRLTRWGGNGPLAPVPHLDDRITPHSSSSAEADRHIATTTTDRLSV